MAKDKKVADEAAAEEITFSAKQVATKLNTDAKTIRKFFRSDASTTEPVGQGGRYEFAESDLPQIKTEFEAWQSGQSRRAKPAEDGESPAPKSKKSKGKKEAAPALAAVELEDDDEVLDLDADDKDPTDEDILGIEDDLEDIPEI